MFQVFLKEIVMGMFLRWAEVSWIPGVTFQCFYQYEPF